MNDPTPTGVALASLASTAGIAILGLEPAPLFWALVGASLGMTFAAAATRLRAVSVFVAVVFACSLFGSFLAHKYSDGEVISRNAFACGLAIFFHPLLNAAITRLPAALDGLMRKFGIGSDTGGVQ
jgi:hypothetical protein